MSHPAVHPVVIPPEPLPPPRVRMKELQGMPGTAGGLTLRLGQFAFALVSFTVMVTTPQFSTVTAFCYLVAAMVVQSLWSLTMAMIDVYAIMWKRSLRNPLLVILFVFGDWVTATLTFAAACASAGITVLIDNDLGDCASNHCGKYEVAVSLCFLSWGSVTMSFFFTFWLLATR